MHGGIAMTRDFINASTIMRSIVPITRFNRGEANKIFDEVESSGMKIVDSGVFEAHEVLNLLLKFTRTEPSEPFLVVIITTPSAAREP